MFESNVTPHKQSCSYLTLRNAYSRITSSASAYVKAALIYRAPSDVNGLRFRENP